MERKELIRFYFDTLAHNDQVMQWYRAFFLAVEGIIVTGMFVVHANEPHPQWWTFTVVIAGLILSFLAVWACVQRGNIVNRQRRKMQKELFNEDGNKKDPNDELADCFEILNPKYGAVNQVPRWTFNIFIHVLIGGLLIVALWGWTPITSNYYVYLGVTLGYIVGVAIAYQWLSRLVIPPDLFEKVKTSTGKTS